MQNVNGVKVENVGYKSFNSPKYNCRKSNLRGKIFNIHQSIEDIKIQSKDFSSPKNNSSKTRNKYKSTDTALTSGFRFLHIHIINYG